MNAFLSQMDVAERRRRLKRQDRTQALGLGTVGIRVLGSRYEQASEALVLIADWQTPMVSVSSSMSPLISFGAACERARTSLRTAWVRPDTDGSAGYYIGLELMASQPT